MGSDQIQFDAVTSWELIEHIARMIYRAWQATWNVILRLVDSG